MQGRSSKKSTTGWMMPEEMRAEAWLSSKMARDMMEDDEQQPQERSDSANVGQEPRNDDKKIEANETAMVKIKKRLTVLMTKSKPLKAILRAWQHVTKRNDLLSNSDEASVISTVELFPSL